MPNQTFATVRAALKTKLLTITQLQGRVDDFHNPALQGYPALTFDISDNQNDFLTNKDNMRNITFQIVIYQEISQAGLEAATQNLDTLSDLVIAALENDFQLANGGAAAVDWSDPVMAGRRVQFQTDDGAVIGQELTLKCHYSVFIP